MKKTLMIAAAALAMAAFARPFHGPGPWRVGPRPHHHYSIWGRGGRSFWPGFTAGVIGGLVVRAAVAPAPAPVVVAPTPVPPAPYANMVWVPGHYESRVLPNRAIIQVWVPGYWTVAR